MSASTGSPQSLQQANLWIKDCSVHHSICRKLLEQGPWSPTRLLNVGDPTRNIDPFLMETRHLRGVKKQQAYATLSHCWGKADIMSLTSKNISQLKKAIPVSSMPRTFQDAVCVARSLKMKYLWIDSLCIIQDSQEDWRRESSLMNKVYRHSFCNIAAAASVDSQSGCFFPREPSSMPALLAPYEILCKWKGGNEVPYLLTILNMWEVEVEQSPLNRRGWVLQEYLLSPRSLHFTSDQVYWACQECKASETFPQGLPLKVQDCDSSSTAIYFPRCHIDILHEHWGAIISDYSGRKLTNLNDKLIAISAVAKEFERVMNDEYLAGLWRSRFAACLNWEWIGSVYKEGQLPEYRAPSWSWASVEGEVWFDDPCQADRQDLMKLLDVKIETVSADLTGQVRGGFVRVQCKLCSVDSLRGNPDLALDRADPQGNIGRCCWDPNITDNVGTYYFMGTTRGGHWLKGIILQESGSKTGQYLRRGLLSFVGSSDYLDAVMEAIENDPFESGYSCEEYDEILKHTITII